MSLKDRHDTNVDTRRRSQLHTPVALAASKDSIVLSVLETGWTPESVWTLQRRETSGVDSGKRGPVAWNTSL